MRAERYSLARFVTSPQGVTNVVMTDWGLHIYYKIVRLVNKTSVDRKGFPWNLIETSKPTYVEGHSSVLSNGRRRE